MRCIDQLKGRCQYLYPHHFLSLLMFAVTRWRWRWFKNQLITWFVRRYDVDLSIAVEPDATVHEHFNAFFTRALREDARKLPEQTDALLSPADGVISQIGAIERGRILQAKDSHFSVTELLGGDSAESRPFEDGRFVTVYLSPRDYHRVHLPLAAKLRKMTHIPGRLFSVNAVTTRVIPNVFARNERLVIHFDNSDGPMLVVLVGAIFVGSMETVWHGRVTPPYRKAVTTWSYEDEQRVFARGAEIGRFNMGSTVIVLLPPGTHRWHPHLEASSPVEVLQSLAEAL